MKKKVFFLLGWFFVIIGVVGIVIPVLPTTPFLLLSVWFFSKSSMRFYEWILNHRILGEYVRSYQDGDGVSLKIKIRTIILLWATIAVSIYFTSDKKWITVLLISIACVISIHIALIRKKRNNQD